MDPGAAKAMADGCTAPDRSDDRASAPCIHRRSVDGPTDCLAVFRRKTTKGMSSAESVGRPRSSPAWQVAPVGLWSPQVLRGADVTGSAPVADVSRTNSTSSSSSSPPAALRRRHFCHCPNRRPFCTVVGNAAARRPVSASRHIRGAGKLTSLRDGRPFAYMIDANGRLYLRRTGGMNDADKPVRRLPMRPRRRLPAEIASRLGGGGEDQTALFCHPCSRAVAATDGNFRLFFARSRRSPQGRRTPGFLCGFRAASCWSCAGRRSGLHFIECLPVFRRF
jgi:hypothetical protein